MEIKVGDCVAVVAPGAVFNKKKFNEGIKIIKSWGLKPVFDKKIFSKDFIFAGTAEYRANQIVKAFKDKKIKAIWCVRGGYGSYEVAELVAKKLKSAQKKYFIGLSDNTALLLLLNKKFNLKTIHGPTVDRLSSASKKELLTVHDILFNKNFKLNLNSDLCLINKIKKNVNAKLIGGNLSLVSNSLGTKWEVTTKNKILFLEEIGEPSYRVHRMLSQLKQAGKLDDVKAVVFGDFTGCKDSDGKERWYETLEIIFKNVKYPVVSGIPSGHGTLRLPLKFGAEFVLSFSNKEIEFHEK
ncbi:MAG: LD-carboxypeptidase [Oligoflexia bacterium]|nr:LD-carboxypeptidase [Oligoflexia bacterium]